MIRLRIGLRLMLLLMALFSVLFAWMASRRELERANLRGEIRILERQRAFAAERVNDPVDGKTWRQAVVENDTMLKAKRRQLAEMDRAPGDD
jgi:hypothetical protein